MDRRTPGILLAIILALSVAVPAPALALKYGGILKSMARRSPPSLSSHDETTFDTSWPMSAVYNNVVFFDLFEPIESLDTVIPELAERWAWNDAYTLLTFTLRKGVTWHDGTPFTARDVKHTFDVVRGASEQRLKLNPRQGWYANVKNITTRGDHEVAFHLERPQPALLLLLATGYSPVYPAHVPVQRLRTETMGTGPFKLTEYKRDVVLKVRKNPDYFVKGRPYLDGVDYIIIKKAATRTAALQAGQLDVSQPTTVGQKVYENLKAARPNMKFQKTYLASYLNIVINSKQPPFDNQKVRQAVNLAIDRHAYARSIQPGYLPGGFMMPPPGGVWGISGQDLSEVPGYGDPAAEKEKARQLMRELGYSAANPLRFKLSTRSTRNYTRAGTWALGELKQVYMEPELEVVETVNWFGRMARRDFAIAMNATGLGADDPDVNYFENYTCTSKRNYSNYCNPQIEKLFVRQSSMIDQAERLKLVHEIERRMVNDVARISIAFRVEYNAHQSYVMNFVGHQSIHSHARFQDLWLDR